MSDKSYRQYTETSYAGRKLLEKHSLNEEGMWQIKGEDPNCDFGGHHYQPDLGIVEGKLIDVIRYAIELPSFWTWGGGGDIIKINTPKKITPDTTKRRAELTRKIKDLEAELKSTKAELDSI